MAVPLLVGLAAANDDPQAFARFLDVLDVERDELRASECASKAKQEQSTIANALNPSPVNTTMAANLSEVAGALRAEECLNVRLMPRVVAFTASEAVGEGCPDDVCA